MKLKRQAWSMAVASGFWHACRESAALGREESGVTSIEYALLASLIAIAAVTSIALLGGEVSGMWTRVASAVAGAM